VTVLKGIRIAAIIGEDGRRQDNKEWEKPQYISFEVTEKQAVFLAYVKYNGKIELAGIPRQE
jgi:Flp pilus assembly protein CpaB